MLAPVLALLAATLSGTEKVRHRSSLKGVEGTYSYTFVFQFACAVLALPLAAVSLFHITEVMWQSVIFMLLSAFCWLGFSLCTFKSDSLVEASVKTSVSRLRIAWSLMLGALVLNETVSALNILGATLIAVAPLLLVRVSREVSIKGLLLEVVATLFIALALMFDKLAMESIPAGIVTFASFGVSALLMVLLSRLTRRPLVNRTVEGSMVLDVPMRRIATTAAISVACYFTLMMALSIGEFSVVMPIYMLSPLVVLLLSWVFLGEREHLSLKLMIVTISTIGAVLTAAA